MPSWTIHNKFKEKAYDGTGIDLSVGGDTVKLFLATDAHAPDAADEFLADATLTEVSGDGYTAGGETLANQDFAEAGGTATFDADNVVISQAAGGFTNARYAVLLIWSGAAATSPIIASSDLGGDKGNVSGDLTFAFNASGIFTM